ncbi:hypothetical protein DSECCO2_120590 [anaerobic digester metagenome]
MRKIEVNATENIYLYVISEDDNTFLEAMFSKSRFTLTESTEFVRRYGFKPECLIAGGKTDEIERDILNTIIPEEIYPLAPRTKGTTYKCYAGVPSIVMHEDRMSSWNCLMNTLNKPEYVLIFKENATI